MLDFQMKEHKVFSASLGESDGYMFRHHDDWIAVIVFHAAQSPTLVEQFPNHYAALEWLESYSCF